jgi:hypothetical protein
VEAAAAAAVAREEGKVGGADRGVMATKVNEEASQESSIPNMLSSSLTEHDLTTTLTNPI